MSRRRGEVLRRGDSRDVDDVHCAGSKQAVNLECIEAYRIVQPPMLVENLRNGRGGTATYILRRNIRLRKFSLQKRPE